MRIGIDLDGVCYNFEDSLRAFMAEEWLYPMEKMAEPQRWSFHDDWGLSYEQFKQACDSGVNHGYVFLYGEPYPGVVEAMHKIKDFGHTVHIITARAYGNPGVAQYNTGQWLAKHDIPYDTLTFSRDKTVVPTDFMAEDNIGNYDALEKSGSTPYLINRPWNQDSIDGKLRWRVDNLGDFAHILTAEGYYLD